MLRIGYYWCGKADQWTAGLYVDAELLLVGIGSSCAEAYADLLINWDLG